MRAVLALVVVLLPMVAGAALIVAGVARRRAPWPWLAGLGIALVPASYMAAVKLCGSLAGTCVESDELSNSRQAIVSVVAFLLAAGLMALPRPRSRARDTAFAALVLAGEVWLLLRLIEARETPAAVLLIGLIALGIGYEVVTRVRARTGPSAAAA